MSQPIKLSDNFNYSKLLKFTLPSIGMMIFTSIYGNVDGFFVSNFAGKIPFAAVNFVWPILGMLGVIGFMFGAGGNAIVSRFLGQRFKGKAQAVFSMLVYLTIALGALIAILGFVFLRPLLLWLGASEEMHPYCMAYGKIILAALPAVLLQYMFQSFFATAEKPKLGLYFTLAAGITNMVLDALFIGVFKWGVQGAAAATVLGCVVGGIGPLIYFALPNNSLLRLRKFKFFGRALVETCVNGSSELLSSVSMSLVSMLYNFQLMRYIGANGVAAYGTIMYVCYVYVSLYLGYSVGVAPIIGFNYGAKNTDEQKNIFRKSLVIILGFAIALTAMAEILAGVISEIYVGYDPELLSLTTRALRIYSLSFMLCGFNIFGSALFTAFGNGPVSAGISFFRTLVCETVAILVLPMIFGLNGIWFAIIFAEFVSLLLTGFFIIRYKSRYGYL